MALGTVQWFDIDKGYGFVRPDDDGEQSFVVHLSAARPDGLDGLRQGHRVSYDLITGRDGKAVVTNIEKVG